LLDITVSALTLTVRDETIFADVADLRK